MSDFDKNNEQNSLWASGVNNIRQGFTGNQKEEPETEQDTPVSEKEITRQSLEDMTAIAGRSQVMKTKKSGFAASQSLRDEKTGISISPEEFQSVSKSMEPFLKAKPGAVMRATALGDFAFAGAVKESLTDPYAKAAIIQFAAEKEFSD